MNLSTQLKKAKAALNASLKLWKDAETFDDACLAMAKSIRGKSIWTPGNFLPQTDEEILELYEESFLDAESKPLAEKLARVNELGFLTDFSQPAQDEWLTNREGRSYHHVQVEALHGATSYENAERLVRRLGLNLYVAVQGERKRMPVTTQDGKPFTFNSPMPIERVAERYSFNPVLQRDILRHVTIAITAEKGYRGLFDDVIRCLRS